MYLSTNNPGRKYLLHGKLRRKFGTAPVNIAATAMAFTRGAHSHVFEPRALLSLLVLSNMSMNGLALLQDYSKDIVLSFYGHLLKADTTSFASW